MERESVDRALQLIDQHFVNQLMPRDAATFGELLTDNDDPEMGLGIFRHAVHVAFVVNVKIRGR